MVTTVFSDLGFSVLGLFLLAFLALLFSSYVKIVTVLAIVRVGIGFRSLPSSFVTAGLAFALAFFVMFPTLRDATKAMNVRVQEAGESIEGEDRTRALEDAVSVWKKFLFLHSHEEERERFAGIAKELEGPSDREDAVSSSDERFHVLAPAFLVSELKEAFATGLSLFLPFLVIDLLVASILTAIGYGQLSPPIVSLPFKLMLFVLVDGWALITSNLVSTYIS